MSIFSVCIILIILSILARIVIKRYQGREDKSLECKEYKVAGPPSYKERVEEIVRKDNVEASIRKKFIELYVSVGSELAVIALFDEAPKELFECIGLSQWIEIYRKAPENSKVQIYASSRIKTIENPDFDKDYRLISWYFYEGDKSKSKYNTLLEAIIERISRLNRDIKFWCKVCWYVENGRYFQVKTQCISLSSLDSNREYEEYNIEKGGIVSKKLFDVAFGKIVEATKKHCNSFEIWWSFWKELRKYWHGGHLLSIKRAMLGIIVNGLFNTAKTPHDWRNVYEEFLHDELCIQEFASNLSKLEREALSKISKG